MIRQENFEGGDIVHYPSNYVVHDPRWWNIVAHVRWIVARLRGRAERVTLSTGAVLRLREVPSRSEEP